MKLNAAPSPRATREAPPPPPAPRPPRRGGQPPPPAPARPPPRRARGRPRPPRRPPRPPASRRARRPRGAPAQRRCARRGAGGGVERVAVGDDDDGAAGQALPRRHDVLEVAAALDAVADERLPPHAAGTGEAGGRQRAGDAVGQRRVPWGPGPAARERG